jgi:hypothetical protein
MNAADLALLIRALPYRSGTDGGDVVDRAELLRLLEWVEDGACGEAPK